jgi:anti-sigma regulatory factor (Ser/Thr protein kinase)
LDVCFKLELASHPQLLSVVRGAVQQLAAVVGFSEEDSRAITLAVDEALTNVIRHAYDNRHDQKIELHCARLPEDSGIEFLLVDHGRSADPAALKSRDLDDLRPGGLGMHLIAQIMDTVQYEPLPDRNQLRLVKYRKSPPAGAGECSPRGE